MSIGTAFAEAADRNVDQVGLDRAQRRLADTDALGDAGAMVLHEKIGVRDHPLDQFQAARVAQVERHRALVAIDDCEGRRDAPPGPAHRAREVADYRRLDLDNVGALVAEDHRRHRAREILRDVDDANAAQWSVQRHWIVPRCSAIRLITELAERGDDLFGDRLHIALDIVVAAGPTEHYG